MAGTAHPPHDALEEAFAAVCGGYRSVAVASGLAAINAAMLAYLKQGDHILMVDYVYGPARNFCDNVIGRFGVETTYYDPAIGSGIKDLIQDNTKIVYVERRVPRHLKCRTYPPLLKKLTNATAWLSWTILGPPGFILSRSTMVSTFAPWPRPNILSDILTS